MEFFPDGGTDVYYARQIEIFLEKQFFHWITQRALSALVEERKIGFQEASSGPRIAHFYYPRRHRYARRQIREIIGLIDEFSEPVFTAALGHHGESLVDVGLAYSGFRILQKNVRAVDGVEWTGSNHNLDRLIERDGVRYGVEIKNTLGYIDQTEYQKKLAMCLHFGVRPLFVARMMPQNYIREVAQAGGFSLIFGNQHYPLMAEMLAKRVRERLKLPVLVIRELPDTTMKRFETWHEKTVPMDDEDRYPM